MNIQTGLRLGLIVGAMGMLAACLTACNDDDPETDEQDGYFESNPYVSDQRVSTALSVVTIAASPASVSNNFAYSILSVSGGTPPYTWEVANPKDKFAGSNVGKSVIYQRMLVGDNAVTVTDGNNNTASRVISQP
ncbi:MAG: hypothetical protein WCS01_15800 [bacterium]